MQVKAWNLWGLGLLLSAVVSWGQIASSQDAVTVTKTNYRGWQNSIVLSNPQVEIVIVPAIGRVMQFQFKDAAATFWENRKLDGKLPNPNSQNWLNFGGDKTWIAPQSDWEKITGRSFPPPPAFDSMPVTAKVDGSNVTLISPVDPFYGIRTYRQIRLNPAKAVMTIDTTYEKVKGEPRELAVWTITQLRDPVGVYAKLPQPSIFPSGYDRQTGLPANLKVENGILSLTRDRQRKHKIGSDASSLLWLGEKVALRIDSPRLAGANYPNRGSSAEIYTNADPDAYVELEFLSPLQKLQVGEKMHLTTTYTLIRRNSINADVEARKIF
jgi:Domain of unknown function (DUF4380)